VEWGGAAPGRVTIPLARQQLLNYLGEMEMRSAVVGVRTLAHPPTRRFADSPSAE